MSWIKNHIIPLVVVLLSVLIAVGVLLYEEELPEVEVVEEVLSSEFHSAYSNDETLYGINSTDGLDQKYTDTVYGGIVSHHLLSNIDIAKFFHEFSDQKVDKVILIGPNHFYPTTFPALSTNLDYKTPFGNVFVDEEYIEKMVSKKLVQIADETVDTEHSVSSLVPYVAHYLPGAKLVPVIFTRNAPDELLEDISEFLKKNNTENTIVISSVDFSHHLYSNASALHDLRSVSAIKSFDIPSLSELEVDSPQSLSVLLQYLESIDAQDISLWQQNAANIFDEYDIDDVTSYVFAHARKGKMKAESGASMLFFGDTMLGRGVEEMIDGNVDLFAGIRGPEGNFLRGYDGIAVNLEGAIAGDDCDSVDDELLIQADNLKLLKQENISHVGVVNNHFQKCDEAQGVSEVEGNGLITLNSSDVIQIEGTDLDIGVLSVYAAPVPTDISNIVESVRLASLKNEKLIVNIHWGVEYSTEPTGAQKELAHAMVDAGADIVIGHHPHVIQSVEVYNDGIIAYSLGNFIADQEGEMTKTGLAAGVFLNDTKKDLFLFPFEQREGVPTHLTQEVAGDICDTILVSEINHPKHSCIIQVAD
ncbi:AmmeMemoRadiSam system protein B [Candidatus Kaiserbacteria bacterium]|nr:AmmeMemoRadiSam system protein B [Candidatus Kaiserbacteria bacterium]MCB9818433.1 AmmeMemoRadiSam system protein B [Candidatus Nomurabacteria bacterium]